MAEYDLPSYMAAPTWGERQRTAEYGTTLEQHAIAQLRRNIGLRNMQREVLAAEQAGADPTLARRKALFDNAHFLFADNPAALVQLQNSAEAHDVNAAWRQHMIELQRDRLKEQAEHWDRMDEMSRKLREATNKPAALRTAEEVGALAASIPVMQQTASILEPQLTEPQRAELRRQIAVKQGAHDYLVGPREVAEKRLELAQEKEKRLIDQAVEAGKRAGKSFALRRAATIANLVANGKKPEEAEAIVNRLLATGEEGASAPAPSEGWQQIGKYRFRVPSK